MADRQTGSVWTHLEGVALQGDLADARMPILPLIHTTWAEWTELHPDTTVLDNNTPYFRQYRPVSIGGRGLGPQFVETLLGWDSRLPGNAVVVGVYRAGESRAYALEALPWGLGVINDSLSGEPILVAHKREAAFGIAYSRVVSGLVLSFSVEGGDIVDDQTGTLWSIDGVALEGPLVGERLGFVTSFITEWYGWSAFHPGTGIHDEAVALAALGAGSASPR